MYQSAGEALRGVNVFTFRGCTMKGTFIHAETSTVRIVHGVAVKFNTTVSRGCQGAACLLLLLLKRLDGVSQQAILFCFIRERSKVALHWKMTIGQSVQIFLVVEEVT